MLKQPTAVRLLSNSVSAARPDPAVATAFSWSDQMPPSRGFPVLPPSKLVRQTAANQLGSPPSSPENGVTESPDTPFRPTGLLIQRVAEPPPAPRKRPAPGSPPQARPLTDEEEGGGAFERPWDIEQGLIRPISRRPMPVDPDSDDEPPELRMGRPSSR
jgi:hypothetical protein